MPALVICSVCGACGHIRRHARCLQPTFYRACGACGEDADACNPRFTVPAVPATRTRMPATHVLPCLWCLRRGRGCLQPTFYRACGACGEEEDRAACDPICEEIKCKEKTRSCLNQTGSDFSLHLTWPIVVFLVSVFFFV